MTIRPAEPRSARDRAVLIEPRLEVESRIKKRIDAGTKILTELHDHIRSETPDVGRGDFVRKARDEAKDWNEYNVDLLKSAFSDEAMSEDYDKVGDRPAIIVGNAPRVINYIEEKIKKLVSILSRLDLYTEVSVTAISPSPGAVMSQHARKVFVVHGHDEAALLAVARFLEQIRLEAIILREQPDQGRTIIEKFEECAADVGFAVVLLTPDDVGRAVSAPSPGSRARENVIFELGYFAGKLGRGRACLMRKGAVEMPSDLHGVIYTDMDAADGWKIKLVRELKAAKLELDTTRIWR